MFKGRRITLFFVVFLLLLFAPFVSKTYNSALELFPGVILPTGSYRHNFDQDTLKYTYNLKAIRKEGNEAFEDLSEHDFLGDIPRHYLSFILKNSVLPLMDPEHNELSQVQQEEVKNWIRQRLRYNHYSDSILIIEGIEYKLEKGGKEIVRRTVKDTYEIRLR